MTRRFWTEIWYLFLFCALGFVLVLGFNLIQTLLGIETTVTSLHILQWEQNLLVFILPVLCWVHWSIKRPICETLGLRTTHIKWFLIAALSILLLSFPMDWFAEWVKNSLPWPEALRVMAEEEQKQQEVIIGMLLSPSGFWGWFENILLMAVITGIAEEFVFRGALYSCFQRAGINKHVAAIIIGFIFALVHFDLYGLIPRWFMGTLLCYLYFWSGSLWPSILAHAINNILALIQMKNGELF